MYGCNAEIKFACFCLDLLHQRADVGVAGLPPACGGQVHQQSVRSPGTAKQEDLQSGQEAQDDTGDERVLRSVSMRFVLFFTFPS